MAQTQPQTDTLNGLDLGEVQATVETIRTQPETAEGLNRWTARVQWLGGFKNRALVRDHAFVVDEPSSLVGKDEAPNAVEYVLSGLGACLATGFVLNATKRGIALQQLEIALDGELDNILTFLGLSDSGHPGYRIITAKLYVQAQVPEATLREVWAETVRTSPVGNTLARNVAIVPELAAY